MSQPLQSAGGALADAQPVLRASLQAFRGDTRAQRQAELEERRRQSEQRQLEQQRKAAALTAALQQPLPHLHSSSPSHSHLSHLHPRRPPTLRLQRWVAIVSRILRSSPLPSAQHVPSPLLRLIASFVHQPGAFGRVSHSLATSAAVDAAANAEVDAAAAAADSRLRFTCSHYRTHTAPPHPVEGSERVELPVAYAMGDYRPPTPQSVSGSQSSGRVYVQWGDSAHVFDADCRFVHSLSMRPAPDPPAPPPPALSAAAGEPQMHPAAAAQPYRPKVVCTRVVRLADGCEHVLAVEGRQLHFSTLDGAFERSCTWQPLEGAGVHVTRGSRIVAVAVSPRDDSLVIAHQLYDGLRICGHVSSATSDGRHTGSFNQLSSRSSAVPILQLLPSPYEPLGVNEWLYVLQYGAVVVCDMRSRQRLFSLGEAHVGVVLRSADLAMSRQHSAAFVDDTLAFHSRQHPHTPAPLLPTPPPTFSIPSTTELRITNLACDDERGEVYLFDSHSRRWLVCDARGLLLRYFAEQRPVDAPLDAVQAEYHHAGAWYDAVRQRLLVWERLRVWGTTMPAPDIPLQQPTTFITSIF